jgi:uncharacterized protein (TIGR02147 family)
MTQHPPTIYEYMDYRKYLQDWYADRKARQPSFSYENFARKAGFKSKGYLHHILSGRRNLTKSAIFKIGEALGLDEKSLSYFQNLVGYGQGKTGSEKSFFFKKLMEGSPKSPARVLQEDHYEFYSKWYYNTVRELIGLIRFKEDYDMLGGLLNPPISGAEARKAVQLLLRLGLIEKTRTGYRQANQAVTTGNETLAMAVRDFHKQNLSLADRAVDAVTPEERDLSCLILSLPEAGFQEIKGEIQSFRKKLMKIADGMAAPSRVYHVNFQFYPTSGNLGEHR